MDTIRVWRLLTSQDDGMRPNFHIAVPDVPHTAMEREDKTTPRICVAGNLYDCFRSIDIFDRVEHDLPDKYAGFTFGKETIVIPAYMTTAWPNAITIPTVEQVPDVWCTHEMWITRPFAFNLAGYCFVRVMYNIPGTEFSRIGVIFKKTDEINKKNILDSVDWSDLPDMRPGPIVYGTEFEFAYLTNNPARRHISEEQYAKDPEAYYRKEE